MFARTTESPILLVGVAHVVDLARPLDELLSERTLDAVAVELDPERAQAVFDENPGATRRTSGPLFARLWSVVQRRLGADLGGGPPGAEMRAAARIAKDRGLPLYLIDDPIRLTLVRLVRSMSLRERLLLVGSAVAALFVPSRAVVREMDRYVEAPHEYAEELRRASPTLARVLLDERNEHMAERLAHLRQRGLGRIAVVVGDAHLPGLRTALGRWGIPVEAVPFRDLRELKGRGPRPS